MVFHIGFTNFMEHTHRLIHTHGEWENPKKDFQFFPASLHENVIFHFEKKVKHVDMN
jgi:hypothetical protein